MKIGIDVRMYRSSVAGIGRYSQNLIKNLLEIDSLNQYILFMTPEDAREFQNSSIMNYELRNCKIVIADFPHYSLAEQTKFVRLITQEKLDLMHFTNFNFPVGYKGRFITTIHDLTLIKYPNTAHDTNIFKQLAYKYVMGKACQNAAKIIAVSENTKKDIIQKFQIPKSKIQVIYEAADDKIMQIRNPKREIPASPAGGLNKYNITKQVILYVGQFRRHKNIEGLIRAFEIIRPKISCQLILLGRRELNYSFKELLDKSKFKRDILMPGFVTDEELANWYHLARVFVFPSFYEGFGLPGLEAMMAGTAVLASKTASLPEIYGNAALYFDPFNPEDIAAKIKEAMESENLRKNLIQKGFEQVKKYSWKKTAEETLKIYKELKNY